MIAIHQTTESSVVPIILYFILVPRVSLALGTGKKRNPEKEGFLYTFGQIRV